MSDNVSLLWRHDGWVTWPLLLPAPRRDCPPPPAFRLDLLS